MNFEWRVLNYLFMEVFFLLAVFCLIIDYGNSESPLSESSSICVDNHPLYNFTYKDIKIFYDNNIPHQDIMNFLDGREVPDVKSIYIKGSYCMDGGYATGTYISSKNSLWFNWWDDPEGTFRHETGHYIWFKVLKAKDRREYCHLYNIGGYDNLSEYSNKNCKENFAENYEHYPVISEDKADLFSMLFIKQPHQPKKPKALYTPPSFPL